MATYTEHDVKDAAFTASIDAEASANRCSPHAVILEAAGDGPDSAEQVRRDQSAYKRGKALLETAKLVETERFRAPAGEGAVLLERLRARHKLASPPVLVDAGHIAQTTAYRYVALIERR